MDAVGIGVLDADAEEETIQIITTKIMDIMNLKSLHKTQYEYFVLEI